MSTDTRPSKRAKINGEKIGFVQPKVGDIDNGSWYQGEATNKFYKEDGCLYYSIQYDDGDFVEEHRASDGIATEEQYGWNERNEGDRQTGNNTTAATVVCTPTRKRRTLNDHQARVVPPDEATSPIDDTSVINQSIRTELIQPMVGDHVYCCFENGSWYDKFIAASFRDGDFERLA